MQQSDAVLQGRYVSETLADAVRREPAGLAAARCVPWIRAACDVLASLGWADFDIRRQLEKDLKVHVGL